MSAWDARVCVLNWPVSVDNRLTEFWNPSFFTGIINAGKEHLGAVDYLIPSLGHRKSKTFGVLLAGMGQDPWFGLYAEAEVQMTFTIETPRGEQVVDAWWMDLVPKSPDFDVLAPAAIGD